MVSNLRSALELRSDGPPQDSLVQAEITTVRASRYQVTVERASASSQYPFPVVTTSMHLLINLDVCIGNVSLNSRRRLQLVPPPTPEHPHQGRQLAQP